MWKSPNAKRAVVGALLIVLTVCAMGAMPTGDSQPCGRFSIITHFEHLIIFDTVTGQLWMQYVPANTMIGAEGNPAMVASFFGPKLCSCQDPNGLGQ